MPFDAPLVLPPIVPVRASAAMELSWLTVSCKDKVAHRMSPALEAEAGGFWGDGVGMLTEILVIAQQLGCLTGWNIDPLLAIADATLDPDAEMNLATEPTVERAVLRACASMEHGQSPLDVIGSDHIACRELFAELSQQALHDGTMV